MPLITVTQLGKAFKRYTRIRHRLLEWLPYGGQHHHQRWVLQNLNFSIQAGESVGLIGRNGAGKSTLLKLLTGTLQPTTGSIQVRGKIAALLELGMGFHPQFTGYDNVLMAGQLQGIPRSQILACMDNINTFAEIGDALHQPVREYSSGMTVRLAFATATAVRPDLLIVDEALAVGDAYFQHKCTQRIKEFQAQGTTLLFVSHDPLAVKTLCTRALLIEDGHIAMDGEPTQVLDYYNALIALKDASHTTHASHITHSVATRSVRSGTGEAHIKAVQLLQNGKETSQITEGEALRITIHLDIRQTLPSLTIGILLRDRLGNEVFGTNTHHLGLTQPQSQLQAGSQHRIHFDIDKLSLGPGNYSLSVAAHGADTHLSANYDWWDHASTLEIGQGSGPPFTGLVRLHLTASSE
jgi:lipopolysaccharide transport system ATP-binding protein